MKREEKIVLDSSDEAASLQTVTGWVSRDGRFYGDDESLARYAGSTHRTCECGTVTEKSYLRCKECRHKAEVAKYNAMPRQPWDGEAFLYSDAHDRYFQDLESLTDHLSDYDEDDKYTLEDLRLIICEPNYARQVDSEFWCDELPEDGDIPTEMQAAMEAFNEVIKRQAPLSWSPGKFAADLASIKAMIGPVELFAEPLPAAPVQQDTDVAKATGTAGELPPLKSINNDAGFWQKASNWAYSDEGDMMKIRAKKMTDYIDQRMREYGQACAEAVHRDWLELQKTEQRLQEAARQPAPVVAVNSDDQNVAQNWIDNAKYLLDSYPNAVRVCEGGGPENLLSSLILNFIALRDSNKKG